MKQKKCTKRGATALLLSMLIGCGSLNSGESHAATGAPPSDLLTRVRAAFTSCNAREINELSGEILRDANADDVVLYLAQQWNAGSAGEQWSCARRPLVRAYLANTLAQAYGNNYSQGVDIHSLRHALRDGAISGNAEVATLSISGLDFVAESSDLKLFEQIALGSDEFRRRDALVALSSQCMDEARQVLDGLERALPDANVAKVRQQYAFMREARCKQKRQR